MSDTKVQGAWKGTTQGGDFGQRSLLCLIRIFGLRIVYFFMAFAIPFFVIFNVKERKAIVKYYHEILGLSKFRSLLKTFKNNFLFGKMMLDRLALMANKNKFSIKVVNEELFDSLCKDEKGFMIGSAHVGNFELAGYALHQDNKRINSVIFGGESPEIQERRMKILEKNNIVGIVASNDMSHIFNIKNALDNGEIVSMPCDRKLGSNKNVPVTFLGSETSLPMGPFIIASHSDVRMIAIFIMREKTWNYTVYVSEITADNQLNIRSKTEQLAKNFTLELESVMRKYPDQWFNFYDFWERQES